MKTGDEFSLAKMPDLDVNEQPLEPMVQKKIKILGIRGIPAAHGGFETFAERLALYLVERGWLVTVYCQQDGKGAIIEDLWEGIHRVHIPVARSGPLGTIIFDWKSTLHAARLPGQVLTLGYNTASFGLVYRLRGMRNLINMDGIEWHRGKWGKAARAWFYLNDWAGCWLGNHLVADHPEIANHLATRVQRSKITMIPYGADAVESADIGVLAEHGLEAKRYAVVIARAEPENSILEMVRAFSSKPRKVKLVILGRYTPDSNAYHKAVLAAASPDVIFTGAIYDSVKVAALRFYARFYVHGHQVGGTNPSLVEAMGAGSAILAHDNHFNRWVAGEGARYFSDTESCGQQMDVMFANDELIAQMSAFSRDRHRQAYTWPQILNQYEMLLEKNARENRASHRATSVSGADAV